VKVESGANAGHALQRNWLLFFRFPGERKKNALIGIKKNKSWLIWLHFPCDRKGDLIIEVPPRGVVEKK
jgi:hypothetical protein